ncbi:unnamed protein product [Dovyalis caffra]|uniref:RRM domain-containing protein n=1 Tax=Dovyalis caffra TaxID=77055 RepID=A0AAV1SM40_9ROSI|nr:unnamed protein product [Dovyalis caffra]
MASTSFIPQEQFNLFHLIDRELYTLLVMALWRDPMQYMQVIAIWIWLERMGYKNVVKKILSLPNILINELADEAIICLKAIKSNHLAISLEIIDIPLMQSIMEKEISLQYFHDNMLNAMEGVARVVNEVCIRELSDIMQVAIERNAAQSLIDRQTMISTFQYQSLFQPMPPEVAFGPNEIAKSSTSLGNDELAEDRTMFVTFSKGYNVKEWEVREFLARNYGDCIESLYMHDVEPTEQPLYARIVFRSATTIQVILNGKSKAKFTINGMHVWARKFVPKRPRSSLPNFSPIGS